MHGLALLICAAIEERAHKMYFGNLLWTILQFASQGNSSFPNWADAFPERKREEVETAADIKKRIVRKLRDKHE